MFLNPTTQPSLSCTSHSVLGARAGSSLQRGAFLLQLHQRPGQPAERGSELVLLALPESYSRGFQGHLYHISAISNEENFTLRQKDVRQIRHLSGKSAPLPANNSNTLFKEMGYGERLEYAKKRSEEKPKSQTEQVKGKLRISTADCTGKWESRKCDTLLLKSK